MALPENTPLHAPPAFRGRLYANMLETIGATPLVRINRMAERAGCVAEVAAKLEFFNPLTSVKD